MNDIKKILKNCNRTSTGGMLVFDNNCVSLSEIKEALCLTHKAFKKEYKKLDKLDLGKYIEVHLYEKHINNDNMYRVLVLRIEHPTIIDKPSTLLYFKEYNGEIESFVSNDFATSSAEQYLVPVDLDKDKVKGYLDLFDKYSPLINTLDSFILIFSDNGLDLYTTIDSFRNNILYDMKNITFYIDHVHEAKSVIPDTKVKIIIDLKTNKIDIYGSYMSTKGRETRLSEDLGQFILENTYVNLDYLFYDFDNGNNNKENFIKLFELKSTLENNKAYQKTL